MTKFVSVPNLSYYERQCELKYMSPKKYLELAWPQNRGDRFDATSYNKKSLENLEYRMKHDLEIDPPTFDVDIDTGHIVDHSGRHRAFIAHKLGIKKIPVMICYVKHYNLYGSLKKVNIPYMNIPKNLVLKEETIIRPFEIK